MYTPKYEKPTRRKRPNRNTPSWLEIVYFPAAILYSELLLRLFDKDISFFDGGLWRVLFFSAAAGLFFYLLLSLLPNQKVSRGISIGLLIAGAVILCVQYCCKAFFQVYFPLLYVVNMSGQAAGDFMGNIIEVILGCIPFILLSLLPPIGFIVLRKDFFTRRVTDYTRLLPAVILIVVLQFFGVLASTTSGVNGLYTYDFATNNAISEFGLFSSLRLELQYALFGAPTPPELDLDLPPLPPDPPPTTTEDPIVNPTTDPDYTDPDNTDPDNTDPTTKPTETEPPKVEYGYNELDIDFDKLIKSTSNKTLLSMHKYFAALTPSQQNEYTGRFAGKNLIFITAEGFSPYLISRELTPTLYRLTQESFVFTNYYQPNWGQSTSGGEFAAMTGVIPTWVNSSTAFVASKDNNMTTCLGWMFQEQGYSTPAYHNNSHTYYSRNKTHPNLGYDFIAIGNGLKLPSKSWPNSDLEMMQVTVDSYINDYVNNGKNFHAYYMTISGHGTYTWSSNSMSRKYKEIVQEAYPNSSQVVQAYIACNLDLEYAMAHLLEKLEAAGIADDTVIVLTADHYPYAMIDGGTDYYVELSGIRDNESKTSRYRNTLILWSGDMEETVVVDTPCSSIDIVPTLCNLFGLEYDSRLYSGRDIFATNYAADQASTCMPLVVLPNAGGNSWITAAGTYEASTKTFTPNPGVEVSTDYVKTVNSLVQAKITYAKYIVQQDYYAKIFK